MPYENVNGDWRADFSHHNKIDDSDSIRLSDDLAHDRKSHFSDANKKLAAMLDIEPELKDSLDLDKLVLKLVKEGANISPKPYTWHHVNGNGEMMLVDAYIHGMFTHTGGFSEMQ